MPMIDASASDRPSPRPSVVAFFMCSTSRNDREPDAGAAHRLDVDRKAGQLLAQMREVDVDDVRTRIEVVTECIFEDLGAGHDLAAPAHQAAEQRVLAR